MLAAPSRPLGVLCDRDGTLIADVPYNDDPARVVPLPGVVAALQTARAAGLAVGIVTNQRGVAMGRITPERLDAVHDRVETLLGPFGAVVSCVHDRCDRCRCRKPRPGLVLRAARQLGLDVARCVVIGDSLTDVQAAHNAGARGILLGEPLRRPSTEGPVVTAVDLPAAIDVVLAWCGPS